MTTQNVQKLSFDDTSIRSPFQIEKYKGTAGKIDRLAMVCEDDAGKPYVVKAYTHYIEGVGYVIANDYTRANANRWGEPKLRFATVIGQYKVDRNGKYQQQQLTENDIELKYFIFGLNKYTQIREVSADFPLEKHDLRVSCEEERFQRLTFTPCKESFWKSNPALYKAISVQAKELAAHLEAQLGKEMSADQINERLVENNVATPVSDVSINADDVISNL